VIIAWLLLLAFYIEAIEATFFFAFEGL